MPKLQLQKMSCVVFLHEQSLDLGGGAPWFSGFIHPSKSTWHQRTWVQNPVEATFEEIICGQVFKSLPLLKSRQ